MAGLSTIVPHNSSMVLLWYILALMLAVLGFSDPAYTKEQSATVSASVDAGGTHTTRLGNLPESANVSIQIKTKGELDLLLINEADYKAFPKIEAPLFKGQASGQFGFSIRVPNPGAYYLVIDNRDGHKEHAFTLTVTASNSGHTVTAGMDEANRQLETFEENLRNFFIFDDIEFKIAQCGTANTFYDGDDIVVLCLEIGAKLMQLGDERKARDVLMFALIHELGHVLLNQWGYPFYNNEELVDEFTTALLLMFNQGEKARAPAELFSKLSPDEELKLKRAQFDRHPLSIQRGRNIIKWLEDPELVLRWQKIFVPHMQTDVLEALLRTPKPWTDKALIKEELDRRSQQATTH
jgi:hypothetical protein